MRPLIYLFLLIPVNLLAQSRFIKTYGGPKEDFGMAVTETPDRCYMVLGYTGSFGAGSSDFYLIRTDSLGQLVWFKTYGGPNVENGISILRDGQGNYLLAGYTNSYGAGGYDFYAIRVTNTGDTLWSRTYGGADWEVLRSAVLTPSGYLLMGDTYTNAEGVSDGWLVHVGFDGDTLWTRRYKTPARDQLTSAVVLGSKIIVFGNSIEPLDGTSDGIILNLSFNGSILSTQFFDIGYSEFITTVAANIPQNIMYAGGHIHYDTTGYPKSLQIKLDTAGMVLNHLIPGDFSDVFCMEITSYAHYRNDIFFFCGNSSYTNSSDAHGVLLKSFSTGYPEWLRTYGSNGTKDAFYQTIKTYDNGFLAVGYTDAFGPGLQSLLICKLDSLGNFAASTQVSLDKPENTDISFNVWPVPTSDILHCTLPAAGKLSLHDMEGRQVKSSEYSNSGLYSLDVSDLKSGIYIVTFDMKGYRGRIRILKK
jgi:hypothetical protein